MSDEIIVQVLNGAEITPRIPGLKSFTLAGKGPVIPAGSIENCTSYMIRTRGCRESYIL